MHAAGDEHEGGCAGVTPRFGVPEASPCARPVVPDRGRHRARGDRTRLRLVVLGDASRALDSRVRMASAFTRDLDNIFTRAIRPRREALHALTAQYDTLLHDHLLPSLAADGATLGRWTDLSAAERSAMYEQFFPSTYPLLTPMAVDATHPLPRLPSLALTLAVRADDRLVYVTIPPRLPRSLSVRPGLRLTTEALVGALLPQLLFGVHISESCVFRVTRGAADGGVTRLEVERQASSRMVQVLAAGLKVEHGDTYQVRTALAMGDAFAVHPHASRPPMLEQATTHLGPESMT